MSVEEVSREENSFDFEFRRLVQSQPRRKIPLLTANPIENKQSIDVVLNQGHVLSFREFTGFLQLVSFLFQKSY